MRALKIEPIKVLRNVSFIYDSCLDKFGRRIVYYIERKTFAESKKKTAVRSTRAKQHNQ